MGYSVVISETTFARHHTSTWRLLAPAIDLYVRKINLQMYEREFATYSAETLPNRRGLINEIAFRMFCASASGKTIDISDVTKAAQSKIAELKSNASHDLSPLSEPEMIDYRKQLERLQIFFRRVVTNSHLEAFPKFPGSGIINSCEGDIFFDETLFEIKAGQRMFRSVDIKQLLTYAALNYASGVRKLTRVGLFNPRMGISFCATLDDVSLETSGCPSGELLPEIVRIISSGEVSR